MLFRKKITRSCEYCAYSTKIDEGQILCAKKGILSRDFGCGKFKYDPLRRVPPKRKVIDFSQYKESDFSL